MPATRADWTVEMVAALEEDGKRCKLIDGELFVTPSPVDLHQLMVGELHARLLDYLRVHRVGKPMVSPSDRATW